MFKKIAALFMSATLMGSIMACGSTETETQTSSSDTSASQEVVLEENQQENSEAATQEATEETANSAESSSIGMVSNTLAEDEETLVATYADSFDQLTYTDEETGLSITYNLYLPEGYDESEEYPMVVFIGDSSCVGTDATYSLTQGRGGLVWVTDEWQSVNPTIVAVPTYPETILDDHGSYTTTEYVELTKRFIDYMTEEYAVDTDRIYGTGQSMGCMTTLILASEYPDLYAACMFVDGQWDISLLEGLEGQTFVYFAAEDDTNAWNGAQEVMSMFDDDSVEYTYAQWDGTWSVDELSEAAASLFSDDTNAYFISWATGTIDASTGNSAVGAGGMGEMSAPEGMSGEMPEEFGGPSDGESMDSATGGTNSSAYHMASFDYAYNCVAVMEWLFQQSK